MSTLEVYPIGKAPAPAAFDDAVHRSSLDAMAALPGELRRAVAGCGVADLDHPVREGIWSLRALVHHVADSHMNAFVRTKLALTEDAPAVKGYDEVAWSRTADSRMDVEPSLRLVEALHERWVTLLASLDEDQLARPWRTPAGDVRPLWRLVVGYAWHGEHHVAQIDRAREHYGL